MNKPAAFLLRIFGLRRPAPTTAFGRAARRLERAATVLAVCYVGLQAFPQVLFAHNVTAQGITLYSRAPLPTAETTACLDRAVALLRQSELAVPGRAEKIFVCDSPWLFRLFSPTSASAFAYSVPITDHVFIASADFRQDVARSSAPEHNTRSLSGVIAHEITHGLIRHRLGWWRGVRLPMWVAEGYCDYVARDGSFPAAEGRRLLAEDRIDPTPSFRYYRYRQMVRWLIEVKHLSFEQVVERSDDSATVEADTRASLQKGELP